jgi:DNA mismatch endonuclease, patch repair protein
MDIWTKQKRSEVMSRIKGKNTKPEMILRSELFRQGFRFRVHHKDLPGKPDIVLSKYRTVIFVHGCFWHFHKDCREGRIPSSNSKFWKEKFKNNVAKDIKHKQDCEALGWNVIIVWECEIEKRLNETMDKLIVSIINPVDLHAHCQSPASQRYNQSFVKELAKPTHREKLL